MDESTVAEIEEKAEGEIKATLSMKGSLSLNKIIIP
jgi:hypothetical protein